MLKNRAAWYLAVSQLSLIGFLLVCIIILPEYYSNGGGVSNYGVRAETILFFSLGSILAAGFAFLAAREIPKKKPGLSSLRSGLLILAIFLIVNLLATYPYKINLFFHLTHQFLAILFYLLQIALVWIVLSLVKTRASLGLVALFVLGTIISVVSLTPLLESLLLGEALAYISFATILVYSINRLKIL